MSQQLAVYQSHLVLINLCVLQDFNVLYIKINGRIVRIT